jgi:hypothetical protein
MLSSDAVTLTKFLQDWAAELRGQPYEAAVHDRHILPEAMRMLVEANKQLPNPEHAVPCKAAGTLSPPRRWWQVPLTELPEGGWGFTLFIFLRTLLEVTGPAVPCFFG